MEDDDISPRWRSRSRSAEYERGSKRRRSSAVDQDWYPPPRGDRYSGGYGSRGRRRGHPNDFGRGYDNRGSRPPENPDALFYQVSFRHFAAYYRHAHPLDHEDRDALEDAWQKYKIDFAHRQNVAFFKEHRHQPWFKERYDPQEEDLRIALKGKGRQGRVDSFLADLKSGKLDDLSFDQSLSDASNKNESLKTSAEEAGETVPDQPAMEEKDDTAVERDTEGHEVRGGGDDDDEEVVMSLTSSNKQGAAQARDRGDDVDEPSALVESQPIPNQLFIKSISPEISRKALEDHCKQVDGFDYLALSEPHPARKFHRLGWATFSKETDMNDATERLSESKIDNFVLHMVQHDKPTYFKARLAPGITNSKVRLTTDLEHVKSLVGILEGEIENQRGSEAISQRVEQVKKKNEADEEEAEEEDDTKITGTESLKYELDLYLQYLRHAFHICYYCICACDFPEELSRRCIKHMRRSITTSAFGENEDKRRGSRNESGWVKNLDNKVALWIDRENIDPRQYGGERGDDAIERMAEKHTKNEDEGKYRCTVCNKLFKAMNFVVKHISTKHEDSLDAEELANVEYFNNYALDPCHVMPAPVAPPKDPNLARSENDPRMQQGGDMGMQGYGMEGADPMAAMGGYMFGYPNMMFPPYMMGGYAQGGPMGMRMPTVDMGQMMPMMGMPAMGNWTGGDMMNHGNGIPSGPKQQPHPAKRMRHADPTFRPNVPPPQGQSLDPRAKSSRSGAGAASYADLDANAVPKGKADDEDLLDLY